MDNKFDNGFQIKEFRKASMTLVFPNERIRSKRGET